jgi:hypothetical protein
VTKQSFQTQISLEDLVAGFLVQTNLSPLIRMVAFAFEHRSPALTAASAGITAVIAISNEEAAKRVAPLPMNLNELRTRFLLFKPFTAAKYDPILKVWNSQLGEGNSTEFTEFAES